jgi:hypothetical protein
MKTVRITFVDNVGIDNVDVVDLLTAKYLKSVGYNKPSHYYWLDGDVPYVENGLKRVKFGKRRMNHNNSDEYVYSAPTRDEVFAWLKINMLNDKK